MTFEQQDAPPPPPAQEVSGISVHRLRYHKRPRLLAKVYDITAGVVAGTWLALHGRSDVIHARSHVSAAVAAVIGAVTKTPFIFDMRGFLGDEFAEAGAWRAGSIQHRLVAAAERRLLASSAAVVVLTERARVMLRQDARFAGLVRGKEIVVVPCGVEIPRFDAVAHRADVIAYVGSVGTWYLLEEMVKFFEAYRRLRPRARFEIANHGEQDLIARAVASSEAAGSIAVRSLPFDAVPGFLARCTAGIVLLREGGSKIASSPIKAAEYLAAGLPVVVNGIVGDMPALLTEYRAGIVLRGFQPNEFHDAAAELVSLLDDPEVHVRARRLAESVYDVRDGARRYADLYDRVVHVHRG